jgi:D-sedoheptulose 7-phosphate isomerase
VFIAISTSGNCANVLAAMKLAKAKGLRAIAWTGAAGGNLGGLCECPRIPAYETARIQECHILVVHILCGLVVAKYFPRET